jgi:hypothetical protein
MVVKRINFVFLLAVLVLGFSSNFVNADVLLKDCEDIAADSSYQLLQRYISTRDEGNEFCQRLDNNEFVYTTNENIYYCKAQPGSPFRCEENEKGNVLPEFGLVKRFSGDKGTQFVLFKSRKHLQDVYKETYFAFYLVPKNVNPRGYMLYAFPNAGLEDRNDGSGRCVNSADSDVVTILKPSFEIVNENKNDVVVRFNQTRTNCKTNAKSKQVVEFTWQNGSFKQTKNVLELIKDAR